MTTTQYEAYIRMPSYAGKQPRRFHWCLIKRTSDREEAERIIAGKEGKIIEVITTSKTL